MLCHSALTSATSGLSSKRTNTWTKMDIDTLPSELFTNGNTATVHEVFIPCSANGDAGWKCSIMISVPDAQRTILQAQLGNANPQCASSVSHASSHEDA